MPREVTVKDVLYGLEFMHAELVRKSGVRPSWTLAPSGLKVSPHVADAARRDPHVRETISTQTEARYRWAA